MGQQSYDYEPFISLNAVTSNGAGDEIGFVPRPGRILPETFTAQLGWGGASAGQIDIEGSIDGVSWFQVATDNSFTDKLVFITDKPLAFLRANLISRTGGTGVTVHLYAA